MHTSILNINSIKNEIEKVDNFRKTKIIAISKTFPIEDILPLIEYGHVHFGENKVQEALEKWTKIKDQNKNLKLHFVGKLQTNKVKFILPLFDYIHSLDNIKLAEKISRQQEQNRALEAESIALIIESSNCRIEQKYYFDLS